jgi:hypothetical protein
MQLAFIVKTRAAYGVNLVVMTSIHRMARHVGYYSYPESRDPAKYIVKDTFRRIITEQCTNEQESKCKL